MHPNIDKTSYIDIPNEEQEVKQQALTLVLHNTSEGVPP